MKTNTKRVLKASALATIIASAFLIGNYQGQQQEKEKIINDAIIYDENHQQGNYFLNIDGEAYSYWFENENLQTVANQNKDKKLFIKDQDNTIILTCDFSNIPEDLQKAKVTSYMAACDDENSLVIFIEK